MLLRQQRKVFPCYACLHKQRRIALPPLDLISALIAATQIAWFSQSNVLAVTPRVVASDDLKLARIICNSTPVPAYFNGQAGFVGATDNTLSQQRVASMMQDRSDMTRSDHADFPWDGSAVSQIYSLDQEAAHDYQHDSFTATA